METTQTTQQMLSLYNQVFLKYSMDNFNNRENILLGDLQKLSPF